MKAKILIVLLIAGILTSLIVNFSSEEEKKADSKLISDISEITKVTEGTKVLQIDLTGGIFYVSSQPGSGLKQIIRQIDNAAKDKDTKGLFIRANSPGGSIAASQELYESIRRFEETGKPIVTSVMDLCASGCYYAVLPSTTIVVNRGSVVGSIGVILSTVNMEELYKKIGVKFDNITSVESKDMLSPARKLKPEERAHLKKLVAKMHEDFVSDVVLWRKDNSSEKILRETANGMVYTSDLAIERGLVDQIGDQRVAEEEIADLLNVPREDIRFVRPAYQYWEDLLGLQVMSFMGFLKSSVENSLGSSLRNALLGENGSAGKDTPSFYY